MSDPVDPKLTHFLADRDTPCPACGYNLRALTTDRCPECNQQLELEVKLTEPKLAAFITGLVCIAMGLGFCGLLAAWVFFALFLSGRRGGMPPEFGIIIVGLVIASVLLAGWLMLRRKLTRMSPAARWVLVLTFSAAGLAAPMLFLLVVR